MTDKPKTLQVPDGRGGMRDVTIEKEWRSKGADKERADKARKEAEEKAFWQSVGRAAEAYNKFHKIYATDHNLTPEEEAAAVYLELLNIREFFPQELGGSKRYDEICKGVWEWFEKNKNEP